MNDKFGRNDLYAGERYRDNRDDRYRARPAEDRFEENRWARSPDQEFETSGPYRQPRSDSWNRGPQQAAPDHRSAYGGAEFGRPNNDVLGYAPSPYVPHSAPRGGFSGRGPKGYARTDERIHEDVCDRLSWNDEVDATDITVSVEGGEVTLEGSVETRHMKRLAEDLADGVSGVIDVHNTIRVKKPILTELKEKITGQTREEHFANTGTKTSNASSNGQA